MDYAGLKNILPWYIIFIFFFGSYPSWDFNLPYTIFETICSFCAIVMIVYYTIKYFNKNINLIAKNKKIVVAIICCIMIWSFYSMYKFIFQSHLNGISYILRTIAAMSSFMFVVLFENRVILKRFCSTYLKFFPWVLLLFFLPFTKAYGVGGLFFYVLFTLFLPKNRKWLILYAFIVILFFQGQRMQFLQILFATLGFLTLKYNLSMKKRILNLIFIFIFLAPIVLFFLAQQEIFNIFAIEDYSNMEIEYGNEDAMIDSRTFLYVESIESAIKNNYWLLGRGIGYGYDSLFFEEYYDVSRLGFYRDAEVFVINIFTWFGLFGLLLFTLLFFWAGYKAINHSNSHYMQYVGLVVAIQWLFCWIENSITFTNSALFSIWIPMALCFSPYWRNLSDEGFKRNLTYVFKSDV